MKRSLFLAVLMALSSSAYAGGSISFSVGGHRVHIESVAALPLDILRLGVGSPAPARNRPHDDDRDARAPVRGDAAGRANGFAATAPAASPPARAVVAAPPPAVYTPAASTTQTVAAPPPPPAPPPVQPVSIPLPPPPPPMAKPAEPVRPAPQVERVSREVEDEAADTPLGDWQTEGKGTVRIAKCGNALCGYVLELIRERQGRGDSDQHEAEDRTAMDRQRLQPGQWRHLLRHDGAQGHRTRFASKPARSAASTAPATTGAASPAAPKT